MRPPSIKRGAAPPPVLQQALREGSQLVAGITPGLRAMGKYSDRVQVNTVSVTDSLELDEATRLVQPQAHRWDYLLGVTKPKKTGEGGGDVVIGVEVHSATDGEVSVVIKKKESARAVLAAELRPGATVSRWCWIASGNVRFSPNSKYRRQLAEKRIEFVGGRLVL